jgi:hypothetical protein
MTESLIWAKAIGDATSREELVGIVSDALDLAIYREWSQDNTLWAWYVDGSVLSLGKTGERLLNVTAYPDDSEFWRRAVDFSGDELDELQSEGGNA